MGAKLKILALGLLHLAYQANAIMLSCKEHDTRLIRKGVTIQSEVGKDGEWVTTAQSYRVYSNETVKKIIKAHFDVTECGNMAVVFPKKKKQDPNSPAGSNIILIDRPEPANPNSTAESNTFLIDRREHASFLANGNLRIYSRKEWGAQDMSHEMTKRYKKPPTLVIVGDTESGTCISLKDCAKILRSRQRRPGLGLFVNFMVGNRGLIFEGRGWDHESGWSDLFVIDAIGSYSKDYPPYSVMNTIRKLLAYGVKNGKIANDYRIRLGKDIFH